MPIKPVIRNPDVNEAIYNDAVRHAIYMERLKAGQGARILTFLDRDVLPDIIRRIESRLAIVGSGSYNMREIARMRDTYSAVRGFIRAAMDRGYESTRSELTALARYEATFQVTSISAALPDIVPLRSMLVMPNMRIIESVVTTRPFQGQLLRQWFSSLAESTQARVERSINVGMTQGESVPELVRRLRGTREANYRDGVLSMTRRDAESVVRTAVQHTVTQAREVTYEQNSRLVGEVQFVATLDARTTPQCRTLDGKVFPVGEGPRPPLHFNCRSTTVPVVKSWQELGINLPEVPAGTRASMNGQVPASLNYGQWLRRQPEAVQVEVLGRERASLFRAGKVSFDRFVDERGRQYTLAELRQREGLARITD